MPGPNVPFPPMEAELVRELRYRGALSRGLVDSVEPSEDGWWDGVAHYRGHEIGRFAMRRVGS